jgi:DNA-directed RNA polymerase subunit RPC12/RpoP
MNKEAVAKELLSVAKLLATTGTFECPECGTKVLENTGYCVKCEKKVKQATTGTFECPNCGTKVLENTGYCVKCEKKVKQAAVMPEDLATLPRMALNQIASLVYEDWKNVNYAAAPYLNAMSSLRSIDDNYMQDTGYSVVAYFLSNATSWHGEVAKLVKKELNHRLKTAR